MKKIYASFPAILLLSLVFGAVGFSYAQQHRPEAPANLSATLTDFEGLTAYDLNGMKALWWSALAKDVDAKLRGPDAEKVQAMQKVIFLSTVYPNRGTFNRSTHELYEIWRFHPTENYRIMAIAAMLANGHDRGMSRLAYRGDFASYAPWDSSLRVRRLTASAVKQYYSRPVIEVLSPQPVSVQ